MQIVNPIFFKSPSELRNWFKQNHSSADELWIGYYKKNTGRPSITRQESVNEALCFGWIDNLGKNIDEISYKVRFTPRKKGSKWSAVNIKRANELIKEGLMQKTGLLAFEARKEHTYVRRQGELDETFNGIFKKNKDAWKFFQSMPPYYRRTVSWWVISAKKEETRLKRLQKLIDCSAYGKKIPEMEIGKQNNK